MKIGIVGLPNVGKSTLFKALTRNPVDINNYPFCTIEPNVGVVRVPDVRLDKLSQMSKSKKVVPTVIEFVDIAGLVRGAAAGEGLGNKFLSHIREVDAIVQVVRVFQNPNITHVHNKIDPENDIEIVNTELILADLETVEKAKIRLEKEARGNKKGSKEQLEVVEKIKKVLEKGKLARAAEVHFDDELVVKTMRELSLLTMKPFVYVYNVSEVREKLSEILEKKDYVALDVKIEEELGEISEDEAQEMGMKSNLDQLIIKSYQLLGLMTYFTTGEDESRAWTIKKNSTAPMAGSAIHTDFQEKFIKADVIFWEKLLEAARLAAGKDPWSKARELGWLRTEGKEYIVVDGDVVEFKI
jgi:ribosome-binding ATPase